MVFSFRFVLQPGGRMLLIVVTIFVGFNFRDNRRNYAVCVFCFSHRPNTIGSEHDPNVVCVRHDSLF
jgi:hypothetical protein